MGSSRTRRVRYWAIAAALFVAAAFPQSSDVHVVPRPQQQPTPSISTHQRPFISNVDVVLVPVTVTDPLARLVTGLEKKHFQVLENNLPQQIDYFYTQDTPISVGLIFDVSGSMGGAIESSQVAVEEFMRTANPDDEFFLVSFARRPQLLKNFTQRDNEITEQMLYAKTGGRTAMLDAIYLGLSNMKRARYARRALIVISDGGENASRYSPKEILRAAREADVQVYTIGIAGADYSMDFLQKLTDNTGGRMYGGYGWADTASKISTELRNQYVLGYRSKNLTHDGQWRRVKVKLIAPRGLPPLHVSYKNGYYAAQD